MYESPNRTIRSKARIIVWSSISGVIALLLLITLFSSMESVGTGKIGVVTNYGKVTGRELSEGLSWIAPWGIESATEYDIKTQRMRFRARQRPRTSRTSTALWYSTIN